MRTLITLVAVLSFAMASAQQKPVVVVELFTSEGCSSCPPADRLLSRIVNTSSGDVEVIGLSFHVDYWDYIGWKDPYANSDFTIRQRAYARRFINNTIYTPQMVVNGKHEFVGSNSGKWEKVLQKERTNDSFDKLTVSSLTIEGDELRVTVRAEDIQKSLLNVAIVERSLSQDVKRGENRGRKLSHDNVVRVFESRQFDGQPNSFTLSLPTDLNRANASLVVYAQKQSNWYVNAAQKFDLTQIN